MQMSMVHILNSLEALVWMLDFFLLLFTSSSQSTGTVPGT